MVRIPNLEGGRISLREEKRIADSKVDVSKYMLRPGDILIVRTNGSVDLIGRSAVVQQGIDAAFASYLIRYRVDGRRVRPKWVQAMLNTPQLRQVIESLAASSAGQHNLSLGKLDRVVIPVPSLDSQDRLLQRLAEFDSEIDRLRASMEAATVRAGRLRESLLAAAFEGRLTRRASERDRVGEGSPA